MTIGTSQFIKFIWLVFDLYPGNLSVYLILILRPSQKDQMTLSWLYAIAICKGFQSYNEVSSIFEIPYYIVSNSSYSGKEIIINPS